MIQRYFAEPYRFVPPYRGTFWCHVGRRLVPRHLRRRLRVRCCSFEGTELLKASLRSGAGIVLAANHCRWADTVVLGMLGLEIGSYLYYLVSYHLLKQGRLMGWWLNRLGAYSVLREGADREAIRATAELLSRAERPVVLFPEGTWFRQNDRLGPLQEGLGLIARRAAGQTGRSVLVHPVGIKYWFLDDPRPTLRERLAGLEGRLGWAPQSDLELVPRVEKLANVLLNVKEVEHFGHSRSGAIDERIGFLAASLVGSAEKYYLGHEREGWVLDRVRRLRTSLVKKLLGAVGNLKETTRLRQTLDTLLLCENLSGHSLEYLRDHPSVERLSETVQRIEETVDDTPEEPLGDVGVVVSIGPPLDVRSYPPREGRSGLDPLVSGVGRSLQQLLDVLLAAGPPPAWGCPAVPPTRAPGPGHSLSK